MKTKRGHLKAILAGALLFALCADPARAGVSLLYYVGYGLYPYGATDVTTTAPSTGLLANNGSGRALVQLIYAGADNRIGDGTNTFDLANAANGYVFGDDVVWQSTVIAAGTNDTDEWGFSNIPLAYTNSAWSTAGFVFIRVFQDDTPQYGDAFYDTPALAMNTASTMDGVLGQALTIDAGPTSGVALDRRILTPTNITRPVESNQWDLMSVPLIVSPTNKFGLVATNAAQGSTVFFYNPAASNYWGSAKGLKGWPAAASNRVVLPGESFFLWQPTTTGHAISVSGTVPVGPVTNQIHERWSALGYPYPVDVVWTDTSLSSNLPTGALVYFWNLGRQQYDIFRKGPPAKGSWGPASNHVIRPGDGFIVRQPPGSAPFLWVQERGE
jgi:hypothetical protein